MVRATVLVHAHKARKKKANTSDEAGFCSPQDTGGSGAYNGGCGDNVERGRLGTADMEHYPGSQDAP